MSICRTSNKQNTPGNCLSLCILRLIWQEASTDSRFETGEVAESQLPFNAFSKERFAHIFDAVFEGLLDAAGGELPPDEQLSHFAGHASQLQIP